MTGSGVLLAFVLLFGGEFKYRCSTASVLEGDRHERTVQSNFDLEHDDRTRKRIVEEFLEKLETKRKTSETEYHHSSNQCGYNQCTVGKAGMLNVHLVPHTHLDVGWLKTVDEYFYGVYTKGVQYILDTVLTELLNDPKKRFVYVEMAFFSRWWDQLHDDTRNLVKGLVSAGRLEFILGGWTMNDEASTHYAAIIDQQTIGFRFLSDNFGDCGRPRVGWQIDPFGHSREQASLSAQFGFDGLFFARLDYQDLRERIKTKTLEHIWMASSSLGDQASIFTGVLYGGYGPPPRFCFECGDAPIVDDPKSKSYNVDYALEMFLSYVETQAKHYTSDNIMLTMGSDFHYENAHFNFKNLDKLINIVNKLQVNGSRVNVFYSTPSCYVKAVNEANRVYSTKRDDFFPYANREHTFWTGYFTSRPALKGYERSASNFLQICKQLDALSILMPEDGSKDRISVLRQALGILQHHDAVSGTEKQDVAFDYARMLAEGVSSCQEVLNMAFGKLLPISSAAFPFKVDFCPLANVSVCPPSENNKQFVALIYNPMGRGIQFHARIPVSGTSYKVTDANKQPITAQVFPLSNSTITLSEFESSKATGELVFSVEIPPLGFTTAFVQASNDPQKPLPEVIKPDKKDFTIKNEFISITFDGNTGLLNTMTNLEKSIGIQLKNTWHFYKSFAGGNFDANEQSSGAYVFRPDGNTPVPISPVAENSVVQGSEVQEVRQKLSDWVSQVVRIYRDERYVEIEWTVGPIPVSDNIGKEVITRFSTDLDNENIFYTDSNGREILQRRKDYRPTWTLDQTEPVAGNYYPVNTKIFIQDLVKDVQLTVFTDRSQGGSSLATGEIELMVHRRTLNDDGYGLSEALDEPGIDRNGLVVRGKHYILLDSIYDSRPFYRELSQRFFMSPVIGFVETAMSPDHWSKDFRTSWSGLRNRLPLNVHLLTLEQWQPGRFLVRLEHLYENHENKELSEPAEVPLRDLFTPFNIKSVEEQTLGANQPLARATRLQWNVKGYGRTEKEMSSYFVPVDPKELIVQLKPMQIRTFIVTVDKTH